MAELPDFRTEPKPTPEGDRYAAARFHAWAETNLDPIVEKKPTAKSRGWDRLSESDRAEMPARVIIESELIAFWLAWHRAGGFAELERGGWDRSTIFRKVRRFRSYYGIHPDDARFPWLPVDWERMWTSDRMVALEWAYAHKSDKPDIESVFGRWRPNWAYRSDPHALEGEDAFDVLPGRKGPHSHPLNHS